MTPIQNALRMRGMTQIELARALGMSKQQMTNLATGISRPGPNVLPRLADTLQVSAAYLRGDPQRLAVWNPAAGRCEPCPIMCEEIAGEGVFYVVEHPSGPLAVLLLRGRQFSSRSPRRADEIGAAVWTDTDGPDAGRGDDLIRRLRAAP